MVHPQTRQDLCGRQAASQGRPGRDRGYRIGVGRSVATVIQEPPPYSFTSSRETPPHVLHCLIKICLDLNTIRPTVCYVPVHGHVYRSTNSLAKTGTEAQAEPSTPAYQCWCIPMLILKRQIHQNHANWQCPHLRPIIPVILPPPPAMRLCLTIRSAAAAAASLSFCLLLSRR